MKLSTRIWGLIVAAMLGMIVLSGVALYVQRQNMMEERQNQLANLVELARASLNTIHEREKAGELNREEAQKLARQTVGSFRAEDRYFWARGYTDDINQIHPNAKRVGVMDKDGKAKGDQYRQALDGKTVGFLLSEGTRPGVTGNVAKLYAVTRFEPWDWIVGYGAYVDDINAVFWQNARIFLMVCGAVIVVVGSLAFRMSRTIFAQLGGEPQYAMDLAMGVASGDLSREIEIARNADSLLGSMRTMQEGLRGMVGRFRSASERLTEAASGLSRHMEHVSQGASMTSEATSSTAAAVEQMTVSIDHISANARDTETNSRNAVQLATRGEQLAVHAAGEIRQISADMVEAAEIVRGLVERSREIDGMSSVIRDIADQTNLLALNAAIEAARAGEQGRGFAVVADEVRKLAERTTHATQDITRTIHAIQSDTGTAATRMEEVKAKVTVGVDLTEKAAAALREISEGAGLTLEETREVALAAQEQSEASNSIAGNIERIAQRVEESDAAVRAAFVQVNQLDELARELHQAAASFRL